MLKKLFRILYAIIAIMYHMVWMYLSKMKKLKEMRAQTYLYSNCRLSKGVDVQQIQIHLVLSSDEKRESL